MKKKKIHIVGGGENQKALIEKAVNLGFNVLVTDMYENPPGRKISNFYEQVNTRDMNGTLRVATKHRIDAIASDATDAAVPTVSYIAEKLGLPGIDFETAMNFTDKFRMRELLKNSINMPRYKFFKQIESCSSYIEAIPGKKIIKPVNSQGSKGVFTLNEAEEEKIRMALEESRGEGVLVEEYIEGRQYSVEAIVLDGVVINLAISEIDFFQNRHVGYRIKYFNEISEQKIHKLFFTNVKTIQALGLKNGITHGEYRIDKHERVYLIEIACRGGGACISSIAVPYLTGVETQTVLINMALGNSVIIDSYDDYRSKRLLIEFFNFSSGKLKNYQLNEKIHNLVHFFYIDFKNNRIPEVFDSRDRYGLFVVSGESRENILLKAKQVYQYVKLNYA